jgi:hypothetical protein
MRDPFPGNYEVFFFFFFFAMGSTLQVMIGA